MSPVFIDTNIPMYAAGTPHPLREPARRVILAIANGQLDAVTDSEVFQEILYRYLHIGEREKGLSVFDNFTGSWWDAFCRSRMQMYTKRGTLLDAILTLVPAI
ncbi:MAG: type II toxin-antitoxin system VapC family toxin [Armatimonadota bacterium]|nr:type II toxin-antitoxin system VapC family toxin [Armatimonadota bacterium]